MHTHRVYRMSGSFKGYTPATPAHPATMIGKAEMHLSTDTRTPDQIRRQITDIISEFSLVAPYTREVITNNIMAQVVMPFMRPAVDASNNRQEG